MNAESSLPALLVISGSQRGANAQIEPGTAILGAGFAADIVINSSLIADQAVKIEYLDDIVTVTALVSDVIYNNKELLIGSAVAVEFYNAVSIGDTQFIIGDPGSFEWHSYLSKPIVAKPDDVAGDAPPVFSNSRSLTIFSSFCLFAVVAVVLVTSRVTHVEAAPTHSEIAVLLRDSAKALSLDQVQVDNTDGVIALTGFVPSYENYQTMRDQLDELAPGAYFNVAIGEKIAADITNIFRTNGLRAEVVSVSPELAVVNTEAGDALLLDKIQLLVLNDVTEIQQLEINDVTAAGDINHSNILTGPGKKIVTVVQGDFAYFVTADKSRYFVGSQLPSGYTIEAISKDQLLLSLGDKTLNLPI